MAEFRDLIIWQDSIKLVKDVYNLVQNFPKEEIFGISSQMKRSAVSIPSNIAEGKGRQTKKEFVNYLHISLGSLYELKTQLIIAKELDFIKDFDGIEKNINRLEKMINSLIKRNKNAK